MKTLLNKLYAARAELRRHDLFMTNQYERLNKPVDQIHKNHLNINILCIRKLQTAEKQIIAYLKTQEQQKKTIDESIDQIKDILYLSNEPKTPVLFSYMKKDIKKGLRHPKQMFHEPPPTSLRGRPPKEFVSYEKASEWAKNNNISSFEWRKRSKAGTLPEDLPSKPETYYAEFKSWFLFAGKNFYRF